MSDNKDLELKPLPKPIGSFVMENAEGVMGNDGMYYHYSDVCTLLKKYHEQELKKLEDGK